MSPLSALPLFALSALHCAHASLHSSIPEDLYAFPKYRVSFLNGLPVSNDTAERWMRDGLLGGEAEFLGRWHPHSLKSIEEIGSGAPPPSAVASHAEPTRDQPPENIASSPVLEHMRLGPSRSYMCLIPPAPTLPSPAPDDAAPVTPSHSWSLLQPLSGTCLYHRQGWFTYSYCHNLHVRQFRELPPQYPHPPGARVIEEDPEWESYTLGKSSASRNVDGKLTANDDVALANNLELARQGAGQRYLVQRWSDGTVCDKTGRPREIEVQFHCSMTMTDTMMFVKETRTCEYILVVHTPRLCGEPGFKSRLEQTPEALLRCREVVARVEDVDASLPEARHPFWRTPRRPPIPDAPAQEDVAPPAARATLERAQDTARLLRRALESLLGRVGGAEGDGDMEVFEVQAGAGDGEFFIDVGVDGPEAGGAAADDDEQGEYEEVSAAAGWRGQELLEALRAAGFEVRGQRATPRTGDEDRGGGENAATANTRKKQKKGRQTEPRGEL